MAADHGSAKAVRDLYRDDFLQVVEHFPRGFGIGHGHGGVQDNQGAVLVVTEEESVTGGNGSETMAKEIEGREFVQGQQAKLQGVGANEFFQAKPLQSDKSAVRVHQCVADSIGLQHGINARKVVIVQEGW